MTTSKILTGIRGNIQLECKQLPHQLPWERDVTQQGTESGGII